MRLPFIVDSVNFIFLINKIYEHSTKLFLLKENSMRTSFKIMYRIICVRFKI